MQPIVMCAPKGDRALHFMQLIWCREAPGLLNKDLGFKTAASGNPNKNSSIDENLGT